MIFASNQSGLHRLSNINNLNNIFIRYKMKKFIISCFLTIIAVFICTANAQVLKTIKLPEPQKNIGKPLMEVLNLRQSSREFSSMPLPPQEISNLLWAAFGINRVESGKRTAPSARNKQEISIYVTTGEGVFVYDAKENALMQVLAEDIRNLAGKQEYVKDAPVNLLYIADVSKYKDTPQEELSLYCGADAGFIAENAYLYCASQGLAVVVRAMIDKEALAKKLELKPEMKIILGQSIGYPKK